MDGSVATKAMITVRFLIVFIALAGGILMIKFATVEASLRINAAIALINTTLLSLINVIGIAGMAGKVPLYKLGLVIAGVVLIILGTVKRKDSPGERGGHDE
ncbi:MAG: DUF2619 domain-containing protein [Bacillota bacterium]